MSAYDSSVFINDSTGLILEVHVDDINVMGKDLQTILDFKTQISQTFPMTDEGECSWYLGLHVQQTCGKFAFIRRNTSTKLSPNMASTTPHQSTHLSTKTPNFPLGMTTSLIPNFALNTSPKWDHSIWPAIRRDRTLPLPRAMWLDMRPIRIRHSERSE